MNPLQATDLTASDRPDAAWQFLPLWRGLGWLGVAGLVMLSLLPLPQIGPELPQGDKWGHLLAYASLSLYFAQWAASTRQRALQALGLLALGALLELLQGLTGYRRGEWLDLLANGAGVLLGASLALGPAGRWLRRLDRLWPRGGQT